MNPERLTLPGGEFERGPKVTWIRIEQAMTALKQQYLRYPEEADIRAYMSLAHALEQWRPSVELSLSQPRLQQFLSDLRLRARSSGWDEKRWIVFEQLTYALEKKVRV